MLQVSGYRDLPVANVQRLALVVPVVVQGLDGAVHNVEVGVDDTGRDLRRKVASAVGLPEDSFNMIFRAESTAGGVLAEHLHEVTPGNAVDCGKDSEEKRQIFVRTLTGKTVTVDVSDTDSVADLKAAVRVKTGGRRDVHRLTINGRDMSDKESLRMCRTHCNVWELGRLRGGSSGDAPEAMDDTPTFEVPDIKATNTTTQLYDLRPIPPHATKQDCFATLKAMQWEGARVVTLLKKGRTGEKTLVVRAETQPPHRSIKWENLLVAIFPSEAREKEDASTTTATTATTTTISKHAPERVPDPTERNRKVKYTLAEFRQEYGESKGTLLFEKGTQLELAWLQRIEKGSHHQRPPATPQNPNPLRPAQLQYGTLSKCAQHPEHPLCVVCEDPACGEALICLRCEKSGAHAGHKTVDITDYMKRQRKAVLSRAAALTAQRTAAEEKCRVLEALPPTEDRYKDLLLQTHVEHLVMCEDVSRSEVMCEEELARSFLTQALSREGEVCALKTFVAKAGDMIAECEAVCQLGDDQVLRAVTESQAVVRSIDSMAASGDRHCLVGAPHPRATFSLKLPVSNVQRLALVVPVVVQGLDGTVHNVEVGVDDTGRDLRRKVASAVGLPEDSFNMIFRAESIARGQDVAQLMGHLVILTEANTQTRKWDAIAALCALGETTRTEERLRQVTVRGSNPEVACLLLQAGVATVIPDEFFSCTAVTCIDISYASDVAVIGDDFLNKCTSLTTLDLSGLQGVTTIGDSCLAWCPLLSTVDLSVLEGVTTIGDQFLRECISLTTLDLSGFQRVTSIGNEFLYGCMSLSTVDLSGLQGVTTIGDYFLAWCPSLSTVDLSGLQAVTTIGDEFLALCPSLLTVDLSGLQSVTTIGDSCLYGCISLSTVDLRALQGVTTIGEGFFDDCVSLKSLHGKDKCSAAVLSALPEHLRN